MATACALAIISGKIIFIFAGGVVTETEVSAAPAPLRGAVAQRLRGLQIGEAKKKKKNALSEAAGIFSFRPLPWDYQGRAAPCLQRRRPPPVADTGRSCWGSGLQDASAAQGTKQTQGGRNPSDPARRNRCDLAALNTQHLLRKPVCGLKAPLGLSCPPGTAVLSGSLLCGKREHIRRRCFS